MVRFANEAELQVFLHNIESEYAQYAPTLWQHGLRTTRQLANASKPALLAWGLPDLHINDMQALAVSVGELWVYQRTSHMHDLLSMAVLPSHSVWQCLQISYLFFFAWLHCGVSPFISVELASDLRCSCLTKITVHASRRRDCWQAYSVVMMYSHMQRCSVMHQQFRVSVASRLASRLAFCEQWLIYFLYLSQLAFLSRFAASS